MHIELQEHSKAFVPQTSFKNNIILVHIYSPAYTFLISYSHEFACCYRYVPLSRAKVPLSTKNIPTPGCSFPSLSTSDEIGKVGSSTLIRCKFESVEAAAKVCSAFAGLNCHNQDLSPVHHTTIA